MSILIIYWQLTSAPYLDKLYGAPYLDTWYGVLFNKLGWGNSVFKIERGREGVRAILNELRIANFPELLISSLKLISTVNGEKEKAHPRDFVLTRQPNINFCF